MEIKKGYKMTDVGVIPEDWEVKSIGELFSSLRSASITKEMFVAKGCMCVHYGDIHTKYGRILDCDKDVIPNVPISLCKNYPNVEDGDIIMADASEDIEGVGKCVSVINTKGRDIISGLHTILLRDRNNSFYNSFPSYMFSCENVKKGIESYAVGTKVNSISYNSIKECLFFYPSKKEQQVIADALTKVDNLITSLTKVIEKKKLIKKGAMQKLLSGEMRLDGFEDEWEQKKIKDIAVIEKGELLISSQYENGNIEVWAGGKVPAGFHNVANRTKNTITISASGAYAGFVSYHDYPIYATDCSTISESDNIDVKYLYYNLINIQDKIYDMQTGGAQPHVHAKDIYPIELTMPPSKAEQTAIANVLTTMDNEIEALEKERDKYKCIKQGMMQQLLTGKIRLTCQ